jgi:hypothetical protein
MTLETKEKHLNRFCKACYEAGIKAGRQEEQELRIYHVDCPKCIAKGKSEARIENKKLNEHFFKLGERKGRREARTEIDKLNIAITNLALKYRDSQADNEQLKLRNAELQVKICHLEENTQKKVNMLKNNVKNCISQGFVIQQIDKIFGDTETKQKQDKKQ